MPKCDIMYVMMKRMLLFLSVVLCLGVGPARANWEYGSEHADSGWYRDDGRRFIILVRGGIAYGTAKMKNDIGTLSADYYYDSGSIFPCAGTECSGYQYLGTGNIGSLPMNKKFGEVSFIGGAAIGWVLPWTPQWRFQVDWDYISESEYNASPLFSGDVPLIGGDNPNIKSLRIDSGSIQSTVTTNVITAMAIRDFYDGWSKPLRKIIPYVGFGLGYADSDTVLNLSDSYGDLSGYWDLQKFGEIDDHGILQFYTAKKSSSNLAGVATFGFSYGISESFFLDTGFRFIYLPKIKWALSNADETQSRDWFHAEHVLYSTFLFGFRWEF